MNTNVKELLKQLPSSLLQLDETPLLGFAPPFPWEKLQNELKQIFELENVKISPLETRWVTKEELTNGLPDQLIAKYVNVAPLEGWICWVMPEADIQSLMSLLLKKQHTPTDIFDHEFLESFEQFLTLETLHTISQIGFDNSLSFHIQEETKLPEEDALCLDVQISFPEKSFVGRLMISKTFQKSWKARYANRSLEFQSKLNEKIDIFLNMEAGKVALSYEQWKTVQPGDFILLDTCSMTPSGDKGRVMLTLKGKPLFRGKIKDSTLKILEYPVYQEADTVMEDEEEQEEMDLEDEEDETEVEDDDETEVEEEDEDEEDEEEEEEDEEEEEEKEQVTVAPSETLEKISPEELPMTITVEIGRLQMSLQKLMELQPGNLLEMNVSPCDGVDLMVNGKRIAKGELLQVGEVIGVRILDI